MLTQATFIPLSVRPLTQQTLELSNGQLRDLPYQVVLQAVECQVYTYILSPSRIVNKRYRLGTPSQIARSSEDVTMMSLDDNRTRKRNTPGDQSMRRTIQDLVSSIDPNVKIEPEVEDVRWTTVDL
jgi:hypothetical protein